MAGERLFTRIPPASTGPRINYKHTAMVPYTNRTGTFVIGERVSLGTSGFTMHVHGVDALTATTGYLQVHYSKSAVFNNLSPQPSENIVYDGVTIAQVHPTFEIRDLYINTNHITSYDNPEYGLWVDKFGSAQVTFAEGQPQLDAFGKLRVSQGTLLGEYVFANGLMPEAFSSTLVNGGTVTWDANKRAATLSVGTTSGALATHTSNTYHHYIPGSSHLFMGTLALGDAGKVGLTRAWGMFDASNGFAFIQKADGATVKLGLLVRSDISGSVVDTITWQEDWNKDKLDGTGPSQMNIDVTKDNLYWIDIQWLGAGGARFGVYYEHQRIVCHEYNHANTASASMTGTGSLPVCFVQENTAATASTSEMRVFCSSMWTESAIDIRTFGRPNQHILTKELTTNDTYHYMGTLAPAELLDNGRVNHSLYLPTELEVMAYDTTTGNPALVEVEIVAEPVMSGLVWQDTTSPTVDYDVAATYYGGGRAILKQLVNGRISQDLTQTFNNMQAGAVKNYSEMGGTRTCTVTNITKAATAVLTVDMVHMLRDGAAVKFSGVGGMTQVNGNTYYMKITGPTTAELYTDAGLTTPLNSSAFGTYTSGGTISGTFGSRFHWALVVKKYFGSNNVKVMAKTGWKEITQ
jgi:hypothetical protein